MRSDSVFSTSSLQTYLSLVVLCGLALGLSIQPASRIAILRSSDLSYPSWLFHLAFVFVFGLFSVNRGAVVAANVPGHVRPKIVLRLLQQIVYGLFLLLPYLIFSRALLPSGVSGLLVLILYTTIAALFFSLASLRLDRRGSQKKRDAFLARYGLYVAFCAIPFGIGMIHPSLSPILGLSPLGLANLIVEGSSAGTLWVGFLVPIAGVLWMLNRLRRIERRHHAV